MQNLWLDCNVLDIKCTEQLMKFPNTVFHARITQQNTICQEFNTSHLWLMLQLFPPRLGVRNDLQQGTFFTHIKTPSCSPEPEEYKYKHHLKFLRPDELNSKNKWLVESGTQPPANSFTMDFSSAVKIFVSCFLEIWMQHQSEVVKVSGNVSVTWGQKPEGH